MGTSPLRRGGPPPKGSTERGDGMGRGGSGYGGVLGEWSGSGATGRLSTGRRGGSSGVGRPVTGHETLWWTLLTSILSRLRGGKGGGGGGRGMSFLLRFMKNCESSTHLRWGDRGPSRRWEVGRGGTRCSVVGRFRRHPCAVGVGPVSQGRFRPRTVIHHPPSRFQREPQNHPSTTYSPTWSPVKDLDGGPSIQGVGRDGVDRLPPSWALWGPVSTGLSMSLSVGTPMGHDRDSVRELG